ncbi:MAG: hypothetical protein M1825_003295 [Sarcosagium campestre]|nr:MAG: hypothetical protein M1825_003295 [Sarcosagium campestre]
MPHKHRRSRGKDFSSFNLPPSVKAAPLPATTSNVKASERGRHARSKKRKNDDDTPKAFTRLMSFVGRGSTSSALDDGGAQGQRGKKRKRTAETVVAIKSTVGEDPAKPSIKPGERMSEFAARVDAALPVSGLIRKGRHSKDPIGGNGGSKTKLERKMQKMQAEWREEDRRLKEKRQAAIEEKALDESDDALRDYPSAMTKKKKTRKRKSGRGQTTEDGEEDPWAQLAVSRNNGPRRLHDVVQAPPTLSTVPRNRFKVTKGAQVNVDQVPRSAGSLRRREELLAERESVVEGYRKMLAHRRGDQ